MPRDVLARVFEPFYTTKAVDRGTGLGLAQVYGFAQQSGGSVDISSEVNQGTTVTLFLPRAKTQVTEKREPAHETRASERTLHVLLVEDNLQVAEVVTSLLTEQGHRVTTVRSGDEATGKLETLQDIDLVFSDLVMPGELSGLDLARIVRARWPALPILLATGYSEAANRATREGFTLISKPYTPETILSAIERLEAQARAEGTANIIPFPRV
jgi:CheY-like chemotaxis protein